MNTISFHISDFKKHTGYSINFSDLDRFKSNQNFIDAKQKELDTGLFCAQINCCFDDPVQWNYQSKVNEDFSIFCFWIEIKSERNVPINSHTFNIVNSTNDFSFQLKKNVLYKGYIFSLSQNWIKRNINSNIIKNYLFQIKDIGVKSLYFIDNEITELLYRQKTHMWQFNVECWQLMGMAFDKIVLEIQNEKSTSYTVNKKKSFDILKDYIIKNIHKSGLNMQHALNILKKQSPQIKKEDYQIISRYIIEIRMNKASELLREGKFSIHEVSKKVGFSNNKLSQFTKAFKNRYGLTPLEYTQKVKI